VDEARLALLLLGVAWALHLPANIAGGVLLGYERYDAVNGVDSLTRIATAVCSIVIVSAGYGIASLAIGVAAIQVVSAVAMIVIATRFAPEFGLSVRTANPRYLRTAFNRSTSYFVISINSLVNTRFDELIIGIVLPLSAVGIYGVSMRLIHMARNISLQLNEVLIPLTSRLIGDPNATHELRTMIVSATRISTGLMAGIALMFIAFGRPFLDLWIGPEVEETYVPLVILSVSLVIGMAQDMPAKTVYASSRHRIGALVTIGGLVSNVLLSILLVHRLDIVGVALATLIAWSWAAVVMIVVGCRLAGLPVRDFVREALVPVIVPVAPAALLAAAAQLVLPAETWGVLVVEGLIVAATYVVISLLLLFTPRDLARFVREGADKLRERGAPRQAVSARVSNRRVEEVDVEAIR
jgi:O-antigen/teichoic acid export membrane protein